MKLTTDILLVLKLESGYTSAPCVYLHDVERGNLTF